MSYKSKQKIPAEGANKYNPNAWSAIRDIFIASMTKGQLPMAIIGIIGIILFSKMPGEKIPALITDFYKVLITFGGLGWVLLFLVTCFSVTSNNKLKMLALKQKEVHEKEKEIYLKTIESLKESSKTSNDSLPINKQ